MADIRAYRHCEFVNHVKPQGHGKLIKLTSTHSLKLFRDMADPNTLVIEHQHPLRRDEVPWTNVQIAYLAKVAEVVKEPEVPEGLKSAGAPPGQPQSGLAANESRQQSQGGQQGKGR